MSSKEGQPTLMSFLCGIPLAGGLAEETPSGELYIRLGDYYELLEFIYKSGAVLGRAMRDKLHILEKLLVPRLEPSSIDFLQELAEKRCDTFRQETDEQPDSFIKFIELETLKHDMGISWFVSYSSGNEKAKKALDKRIPIETEAAFTLNRYGLEGIGFGSRFPELTERMCRTDYENIMSEWTEARACGLDVPNKPPVESLDKREENVLQVVAAYVAKYYPELLDPLGLDSCLESS